MQGSLVKSIVACIALVVLCYILGAAAAESAVSSFAIFVALVGICLIVWLGKRCWCLLFILPPFTNLIPSYILHNIKGVYYIAVAVMGYWLLMWLLGHVRMRWKSMMMLDLLLLLLVGYMAVTFIHHPVALGVFGLDYDMIGGLEYVYCVLFVLLYLAVSLIPVELSSLSRLLKWTPFLVIACVGIQTLLRFTGVQQYEEEQQSMGEAIQQGRFTAFMTFGAIVLDYVYSHYSLKKILLSPILLLGAVCAVACMMLGGFRSNMLLSAMGLTCMAVIKKEAAVVVTLCMGGYACLLLLSMGGAVERMPYGIQRCMVGFPGISVRADIEREALGTLDWRYELWDYAFDSRTGAIRDYVWGDGFGQSKKEIKRDSVGFMRGTYKGGTNENAAKGGAWHSGWISVMQTMGIVGLSIISLILIYMMFLVLYVGAALRGTSLLPPYLFYVVPIQVQILCFYVVNGSMEMLFANTFVCIAYLKLIYCTAREAGKLKPVFKHKRYVPQMIQQYSDRIHQPI